jgi:hypothetical protein
MVNVQCGFVCHGRPEFYKWEKSYISLFELILSSRTFLGRNAACPPTPGTRFPNVGRHPRQATRKKRSFASTPDHFGRDRDGRLGDFE